VSVAVVTGVTSVQVAVHDIPIVSRLGLDLVSSADLNSWMYLRSVSTVWWSWSTASSRTVEIDSSVTRSDNPWMPSPMAKRSWMIMSCRSPAIRSRSSTIAIASRRSRRPGGTHRRPPDDGECLDQRNVGLVETPRLVRQIEVPENGVPGPAGVPPRNDSIGGCPSGNPYESA